MNIQQTSFSHKVIGPDATAAAASAGAGAAAGRPTLQFQESIDSVSGEEEGARMRAERHSPEVEAELDEWWALCRLVAATLAEPAPTAAVGRAAYCAMHMLISRAIVSDIDEEEGLESAEDDWIGDTHADVVVRGVRRAQMGRDGEFADVYLSADGWRDSMYELACVWAPDGGGPMPQREFLQNMRAHLTVAGPPLRLKDLDEVDYAAWLTGGDAEEPALPPADTGWSPFAGRPATPPPPPVPRAAAPPVPRAAAPPAARPPAAAPKAPPAAAAPAAVPPEAGRRRKATARTQAAPARARAGAGAAGGADAGAGAPGGGAIAAAAARRRRRPACAVATDAVVAAAVAAGAAAAAAGAGVRVAEAAHARRAAAAAVPAGHARADAAAVALAACGRRRASAAAAVATPRPQLRVHARSSTATIRRRPPTARVPSTAS